MLFYFLCLLFLIMLFNLNFNFKYLVLNNFFLNYPKILLAGSVGLFGNDLFDCYYSFSLSFFLFLTKSSLYRLKTCVETTLIDTLCAGYRYCLVYILLSTVYNKRFTFCFRIKEYQKVISLTSVFYSIN